MTIAPFSFFGNMPNASSPFTSHYATAGEGGFTAFFASLLSGELASESFTQSGKDSQQVFNLFDQFKNGDLTSTTHLGSALSLFSSEANLQGLSQEARDYAQGLVGIGDGQFNDIEDDLAAILAQIESGSTNTLVYEKLVVEVQQSISVLQAQNTPLSEIEGVDELATAYKNLGFPAQEAEEKAKNVVIALEAMKARLQTEKGIGEDYNLSTALFQMSLTQLNVFTAEQNDLASQKNKVMLAFESGSSLSSGDLGMTVMKGEPLKKESAIKKLVNNTSEPALDDFDVQTAMQQKALAKPLVSGETVNQKNTEVTTEQLISQAQNAETSVKESERRTSFVDRDKVLKDGASEKLFTVKASENSELAMSYETEQGDVVNIDNIDEGFEEVMEVVNRRTAFESRTESGNLQAHVRQAKVASQVEVQMKQLANQGGGQIKFRLDPPELGELDIHLKIHQGTVRGTIIVQNAEVAESLARDLRILQQSFEEAGLHLHEEGIQFRLQEDGSHAGNGQQSAGGKHGDHTEDDEMSLVEGEEIENSSHWVKPDALVDVSV